MNKNFVIIGLLLLALAISIFYNFNFWIRIRELEGQSSTKTQEFPDVPQLDSDISTFEECAAAGYPVMESYPERCATPDGRSFTRDISGDGQVQAE